MLPPTFTVYRGQRRTLPVSVHSCRALWPALTMPRPSMTSDTGCRPNVSRAILPRRKQANLSRKTPPQTCPFWLHQPAARQRNKFSESTHRGNWTQYLGTVCRVVNWFGYLGRVLLGDIGREAVGMFARCQSDFRSAVLRGVVIEHQYNFFCEYHYLQVTYTMGNLTNTTKEVNQTWRS